MKSAIYLSAIVVVAFFSVVAYSQLDGKPTAGEITICEKAAEDNGQKFKEAVKEKRLSCHILCKFSDGTSKSLNSPDDQLCCTILGGGPTGVCQNGTCPIGLSVSQVSDISGGVI